MKQRKTWNQIYFHRAILVGYDIASIAIAEAAALLLRFEFDVAAINTEYIQTALWYFPINVMATLLVFYVFRLYQSLWVFAGVTEMQNIVTACMGLSFFHLVVLQLLHWRIPRSFYFLYGILFMLLVMLSRFLARFLHIKRKRKKIGGSYALLVGAGEAGHAIIEESESGKQQKQIVAVIDDDPRKWGSYIHGIEVIGGREKIRKAVEQFPVDRIILAMPSVEKKSIREIYTICKETGLEVLVLPGIQKLILGEPKALSLRKAEIVDLFGENLFKQDLCGQNLLGQDLLRQDLLGQPMQETACIKEKTILVISGGNLLEEELCRQIVALRPIKLIILDIYENHAYDIQQELRELCPEGEIEVLIGFAWDIERIRSIFKQYMPDIVYYAMPCKNAGLMEQSVNESVEQNVFGAWRCMEAAKEYKVGQFFLLSSEKAIYPEKLPEACLRIGEMLVQQYDIQEYTKFTVFRLGEILEDREELIHQWKKQIQNGGTLYISNPEQKLHFVSVKGAAAWLLKKSIDTKGSQIVPMEIGEEMTKLEFVKNMVQISGLILNEDIQIKTIGNISMDKKEIEKENIYPDKKKLLTKVTYLQQMIEQEPEEIRTAIQLIVPEYQGLKNYNLEREYPCTII
ncbi:MAG: polysaccharide biosynthesis protein [Lachnospiraceae bacterium]|nr:polysaccharide biosynthesis protein [Lachnospiraceae bacterium]